MKRKLSGGFTLIELMITVGIVGILASVALPTFTRYKYRAYEAEVQTNLAALYRGLQAYYSEEQISGQGTAAISFSHCLPVNDLNDPFASLVPNPMPTGGAAVMYDFSQHALYRALSFEVAGPVRASYMAHPTSEATTLSPSNCEITNMGTDPAYQFLSAFDFNGDGTVGIRGFTSA